MLVRLVAIFEKSRREASVLFRSEKLLYFMALFCHMFSIAAAMCY